jgi:hypothetical protein
MLVLVEGASLPAVYLSGAPQASQALVSSFCASYIARMPTLISARTVIDVSTETLVASKSHLVT